MPNKIQKTPGGKTRVSGEFPTVPSTRIGSDPRISELEEKLAKVGLLGVPVM